MKQDLRVKLTALWKKAPETFKEIHSAHIEQYTNDKTYRKKWDDNFEKSFVEEEWSKELSQLEKQQCWGAELYINKYTDLCDEYKERNKMIHVLEKSLEAFKEAHGLLAEKHPDHQGYYESIHKFLMRQERELQKLKEENEIR